MYKRIVITMPIVTFTYFVQSCPTRFFGKYVSSFDIPIDIGIDAHLRKELIHTLNLESWIYGTGLYYDVDDVDIGVLSYTEDNAWTTYREVHAFDTYIEVKSNGNGCRRWTQGNRLLKKNRLRASSNPSNVRHCYTVSF